MQGVSVLAVAGEVTGYLDSSVGTHVQTSAPELRAVLHLFLGREARPAG